jgi:hypothetical protein
MTIHFSRKDAFLFQPPAQSGREIEKLKSLGDENILKSVASGRRNLESTSKIY